MLEAWRPAALAVVAYPGENSPRPVSFYVARARRAFPAIKQFGLEYQFGRNRPRYRRAATPAEVSSISRAVLDTLRRGWRAPLSGGGIKAIMTERGLDLTYRALVRSMNKRVDMALQYQRKDGMVEEVASGGSVAVWGLAE